MKIYFDSDYMRGAHPEVMRCLSETNLEATPGYGLDEYTSRARELILQACGISDGDVKFLVGGTQTNTTVIDALLHKTEGVLSAETSHINVHESGAIEASGHKVITLPTKNGKIYASDIDRYLKDFYADDTWQHMVIPGMVYITQPTELGTLYTLAELEEIAAVARRHDIRLYIDGARLAYALASPDADFTLPDLARLCDAFYIGGTKCGTLFGEAVVLPRPALVRNFFTHIKQHGALFAKGRILGIQFKTLFTDNLYQRIGENAIRSAMRLKQGVVARGYGIFIDSPTNQQFFVLPNELIDRLQQTVTFEYWGPRGEEKSVVRFVTDWATTDSDIDKVLEALCVES